MRSFPLVLLITACGACGDDGGSTVDATPVIDINNGSCGAMLNFSGELVDADSTMAMFCGVNGAMLSGGGAMKTTAPNGRIDEMCIPDSGVTQITVTPAATASGCVGSPGTYMLPGLAIANPATIKAGGFFSARMITMQRLTTLVPGFDIAKAHVMVHVDGPPRGVAILATHAPALAYNGTAWAAGESGTDVLFPNVDAAGSTTLTVVGGAIGTGSIPLQAGKLTLVTVMTR
jgi:hypothetical protein